MSKKEYKCDFCDCKSENCAIFHIKNGNSEDQFEELKTKLIKEFNSDIKERKVIYVCRCHYHSDHLKEKKDGKTVLKNKNVKPTRFNKCGNVSEPDHETRPTTDMNGNVSEPKPLTEWSPDGESTQRTNPDETPKSTVSNCKISQKL